VGLRRRRARGSFDQLRKVFLSAAGTYAELELGADPHYDSTGLQRVHSSSPAHYSLVGPTAGPPWKDGAVAVGPQWTMRPGCDPLVPQSDSLANATFRDVSSVEVTPGLVTNASAVSATVQFALTGRSVAVQESITVLTAGATPPAGMAPLPPVPAGFADAGTVLVAVQVTRQRPCDGGSGLPFSAVGPEWPALVFDGRTNFSVSTPANDSAVLAPNDPADVARLGATQLFVLPVNDDLAWTWAVETDVPRTARNGVVVRVSASLRPASSSPEFVMGVRALVATSQR